MQLNRYALKLGYFGYRYHGFVSNGNKKSILNEIILAFEKYGFDIEQLNIQIASRTDKGVHAISQVIAITTDLPIYLGRLNKYLPDDIWFWALKKVDLSFNPRKEALYREYIYLYPHSNEDVDLVRKALGLLIGTHNFYYLSKHYDIETNYTRTIDSADFTVQDDFFIFKIRAKSFLWQQVRRMLSAVILVGKKVYSLEELKLILNGLVQKYPSIQPLPPEGLILADIGYSFSFDHSKQIINDVCRKLSKRIIQLMLKKEVIRTISDFMKIVSE